MDKLIGIFQGIKERFMSLAKGVKIIISVMLIVVLASMIFLFVGSPNNGYKILFSNLESSDAQTILDKLVEQNISYKVSGNSILVPENKVDELRLSLAADLSSGTQGYELMDTSSTFGMSDEEFQLKKMRMLQGELERTIKSFSQIEDVRVHITSPKESVFAENKEEGKAAVYIKLKSGKSLSEEQVLSIVSLVSGSAQGIPKENIEVIDQNMNLLSNNDSTSLNASDSVKQQQILKKEFESELQKTVLSLLEPVFGKNKVSVAINADLDFDSVQKNEIIIDPNNVIISHEINKESTNSGTGNTSNSPVDNNMGNTIDTEDSSEGYIKNNEIINYEVGRTESTVISAPGKITRLTASVLIDGDIDDKTRNSIEKAITTAIGLNKQRNDEVNVIGMSFNGYGSEGNVEDVFTDMEQTDIMKNFTIYTGIGLAAVILIIPLFLLIKNKKK
ncbi:flagellar basal-body MS-ring/collar protein FliF, partial [Clostridium sp.]|uniref:flagellar basal-body MS-ring/collar protein FliF n=1 Tax=Clostridium sp. TaxID=1506 RepID=UPI001B4EB1C5